MAEQFGKLLGSYDGKTMVQPLEFFNAVYAIFEPELVPLEPMPQYTPAQVADMADRLEQSHARENELNRRVFDLTNQHERMVKDLIALRGQAETTWHRLKLGADEQLGDIVRKISFTLGESANKDYAKPPLDATRKR